MSEQQHEKFMRRAIELSEIASLKEKSGGVFGSVIVKDNEIIAEGYNQVIKQNDPTWHGEMQAIREACKKLNSPHLEGCILYTSAEPCPMCMATAYWAHLDKIYYAAHVEDAVKYGDFDDSMIYKELAKEPTQRNLQCKDLISMRPEAVKIWKAYSEMPDRKHY
ncbi:MAG: tRNA-specific adenosine deaminase [Gammaproteobacteria bacterium 39-13]|jgi:tRNA(Arg) A34 adenosine deaminase TadA|nr:nucleoside deaminase [Gammaproteobacteria bacterium]OJV93055.1 MAG: tRNA-specific adenosine deaminase [Gammaproteobacteria bacterium 39-13]